MKLHYIAPLALAALAALWPSAASAAPVSPEKALGIAAEARKGTPAGRKAPGAVAPSIVLTRSAEGLSTALYGVDFGQDQGFAIVAGDDSAPLILGYADSGSLDPSNLPPALEAMLADYAASVARLAASASYRAPEALAGRKEIEPLVTSTWNQTAPYNAYCPKNGYDRCPVGCVALSTGQVMRTHQWPPKSRGTVIYEAGKFRLNTEYDWASMPDSGLGLPSEQTDNMAKMLYELARSLFMTFTGTSAGTYSYYTPDALVTNFAYDPIVEHLSRNFYTDDQWEQIIYSQLAAGQAMPYDGQAISEGHSFVCDGYRDGYFHINWGWEGKSDGYFLLSNLDPEEQGVGGANSGFFRRHGAVVNIRAPKGGLQPMRLSMTGSLAQGEIPNTFRVDDYDFDGWDIKEGIFNLTGRDFTSAIGLRAVNVADPSKVEYFFEQEPREWVRWFTRAPYIQVDITSLPDGRYYLYPVSRDEFGRIADIECPASRTNILEATISGGSYTCSNVKKEGGAAKGVVALDNQGRALDENKDLTTPDLTLQPGEFGFLHPYLQPLDADAEFEWSTADPEIAVVIDGMVIAGGKTGNVIVSATVKGNPSLGRDFLVEIEHPSIITSLTLAHESLNLGYGEEYTLEAVVSPEKVSNPHLKFTSSDEEIAVVSADGVVTAKDKDGTAEIKVVTLDGSELEALCTVNVSKEGSVDIIGGEATDNESAPVYTTTGIRVGEARTASDLHTLPAGLYLWKGRKILLSN